MWILLSLHTVSVSMCHSGCCLAQEDMLDLQLQRNLDYLDQQVTGRSLISCFIQPLFPVCPLASFSLLFLIHHPHTADIFLWCHWVVEPRCCFCCCVTICRQIWLMFVIALLRVAQPSPVAPLNRTFLWQCEDDKCWLLVHLQIFTSWCLFKFLMDPDCEGRWRLVRLKHSIMTASEVSGRWH